MLPVIVLLFPKIWITGFPAFVTLIKHPDIVALFVTIIAPWPPLTLTNDPFKIIGPLKFNKLPCYVLFQRISPVIKYPETLS